MSFFDRESKMLQNLRDFFIPPENPESLLKHLTEIINKITPAVQKLSNDERSKPCDSIDTSEASRAYGGTNNSDIILSQEMFNFTSIMTGYIRNKQNKQVVRITTFYDEFVADYGAKPIADLPAILTNFYSKVKKLTQ